MRRVIESFGGKYLVRGGEFSYPEGECLEDLSIVIEFPSRDAAHAWGGSEQYQAIVKGRTENSTGPVFIIDGVPE